MPTQTLTLTNFDSGNITAQSQLTSNIAAAVSSLPVDNTADFVTTNFVLIGVIGSNVAELGAITGITDPTDIATTSPTKVAHTQYDPVYQLLGDQLRVYRAANVDDSQPADTEFSVIATIDIIPNQTSTPYTDNSGGGNYWYKYTHYNSVSFAETSLASSVAIRGSFTVNYASIDEIRQRAGFQYAPYVTDTMIDAARQSAQDEVNGALDEFYETPLQPPINDYLRDIVVRLAVGHLLLDQYGQSSAGTTADGKAKLADAQGDLKKLVLKERVLVGKDGKALDGPGATGGIGGWPNKTTSFASRHDGGAPRQFRMSDIAGRRESGNNPSNQGDNIYYGRKY